MSGDPGSRAVNRYRSPRDHNLRRNSSSGRVSRLRTLAISLDRSSFEMMSAMWEHQGEVPNGLVRDQHRLGNLWIGTTWCKQLEVVPVFRTRR